VGLPAGCADAAGSQVLLLCICKFIWSYGEVIASTHCASSEKCWPDRYVGPHNVVNSVHMRVRGMCHHTECTNWQPAVRVVNNTSAGDNHLLSEQTYQPWLWLHVQLSCGCVCPHRLQHMCCTAPWAVTRLPPMLSICLRDMQCAICN
jgi:hypothetical protein